jgi:hypothetical protein
LKEAVGEASTVWVTGYQVLSQEIELPKNLVVIKDTDEMRKLLSE